jgi:hypothetical protein
MRTHHAMRSVQLLKEVPARSNVGSSADDRARSTPGAVDKDLVSECPHMTFRVSEAGGDHRQIIRAADALSDVRRCRSKKGVPSISA